MEVLKFNENMIPTEDRVFRKFDKTIKNRHLTYYKSKGYRLYYYSDFNLIEIPKLVDYNDKTPNKFYDSPWGKKWDKWGEMIFFLDDSEYENSKRKIDISKELYDKYIENANNISKYPMSYIYHNVLKLKP